MLVVVGGFAPADLDQVDDVLVAEELQDAYLTEGGDGKTLLLVVHQNLPTDSKGGGKKGVNHYFKRMKIEIDCLICTRTCK